MNSLRQISYGLMGFLFLGGVWFLWGANGASRLRLAHNFLSDSYQANVLKIFSHGVNMGSKGKIQVEVLNVEKDLWPSSKIKKAVEERQYEVGSFYLEDMRGQGAVFGMDSIPLMAQNYKQAIALWDVTRYELTSYLRTRGLIYLFSLPSHPQSLFLSSPIKKKEDLKGKKIRTYGDISDEIIRAFGAIPIKLREGEAYDAFIEGRVDGFLGGIYAAYRVNHNRSSIFYYPLHLSVPKNVVVMRADTFATFSSEEQQRILMHAQKVETIAWRMSQASHVRRDKLFKPMKAPQWFQDRLMEISKDIFQEWRLKTGSVGEKFLRQYKNILRSQLIPEPSLIRSNGDKK